MPSYRIDDLHVKIPAGWMIEQIGWKGKSMGNVAVHKDQALVLINLGGASAQEIIELYQYLIKKVEKEFGIIIYPEVNIIWYESHIFGFKLKKRRTLFIIHLKRQKMFVCDIFSSHILTICEFQ